MLEVEHLTVAYGPHRALEDVSVKVAAGEICVILGANGAGKSTLLKAIAGMVRAQAGAAISIGGRDIAGEKPNRIVEAGVALVPEGRGIFADLTVAENLQLGAYGRQARAEEAARLGQVLDLFPKLGERRGQTARTMSGGEQQMVAIGRALMSNPAILMLDEPSLGLSPLLTKELFHSLRAVRDTGVGILLVEQNARQSLAIADRGYLLENGHIVGEDSASRLADNPAVQAAYLGGASAAKSPPTAPRPASERGRALAAAMAGRLPAAPRAHSGMAVALAERAARIQRDHVERVRAQARRERGEMPAAMNGSPFRELDHRGPSRETKIMSSQAEELSRRAAELASRAQHIQAAHIAAMRARSQAESAAEIYLPAMTEALKPKKDKKSGKKNRKARKAGNMKKKAKKAGK